MVKFADSKKQLKLKEEGGGISLPDNGNQIESQPGSSKMPDYWSKQFQQQQQQQQQQMMYSYSVPAGNIQQQQQMPVPVSMPYGSHNNSQQQQQQQQFMYMSQQTTTIPGYSYDLNSSGHSDGSDTHQQSRYSTQQQTYSRQGQQQPLYSNSSQRDQPARQRNAWPPSGGRNDKHNGSSNNHQEEDLYTPLDSNGEISSRSLPPGQRPTEGVFSCQNV